MKRLKLLLSVVMLFAFSMCFVSFALNENTYADEPAQATEAPYAKLGINDMVGYSADGASWGSEGIAVSSGQSFRFDGGYKNVEVSFGVKYSAVGNIQFALRSPDGAYNTGYYVLVMPNGRYYLITNGETVYEANWPPHSGFNTETEHKFVFKTVDMSDGSVQITLTVDGAQFFSYNDNENQVTDGGYFVVRSDGSQFTITGEEEQKPDIYDLTQMPVRTSNQLPGATIDGTTLTTGVEYFEYEYSGASYVFSTEGYYGYKTKVTPLENRGGKIIFQLAGGSPASANFVAPEITDNAPWGQPGYVLYWSGNGQIHLANGNPNVFLLAYVWQTGFEANVTYDVEFYAIDLGDGTVKVSFKALKEGTPVVNITYLDKTGIIKFNGLKTVYNTVHTIQTDTIFEASEEVITSTTKTLITTDVGSDVAGDATFGPNGEVSALGTYFGYDANLPENTTLKFIGNFSEIGNVLQFGLGNQGEWNNWSQQGYDILLFTGNGMVSILKNGCVIWESWLYDYDFVNNHTFYENTDYIFEIGTRNLGDGVHVFLKINGATAVDFVDKDSLVTTGGWFTVYNDGFEGSLRPYGVDIPMITTNKTALAPGSTATLSCEINDVPTTEGVTYYIDTEKSTIDAILDGNTITATQEGIVVVYAIVDGVYSNYLTINFAYPKPVLTGTTSNIVAFHTNVTLGVNFDADITSKEFCVENLSGEATIDQNTGALTPVKAGQIRVWAIVNGSLETDKTIMTISPIFTVDNPGKLLKGQTVNLQYSSNIEHSTDGYSVVYQIVSGADVASVTPDGQLTVLKDGSFSVNVTINGPYYNVISDETTITAVKAVLLDVPSAPIVYGGQDFTIDAGYSDGTPATSKTFHVINLSGRATITAEGKIIPEQAGTFKVYATVDGAYTTEEVVLTIDTEIDFNKVGSFAFGGVYNLNDYVEFICPVPDEDYDISFEIVSGNEFVSLEDNVLTVGNTPGVFRFAITVIGETFSAIKPLVEISIERPIVVVQNSFLADLYVGQTVELVPSISQGGVEITSKEIIAVEGADCVTINGMNITAIKAGTFKFKVLVNDTWYDNDAGLEIAIEPLTATIVANDEMFYGRTQQAEIMTNADADGYEITSVVWSVINGADVVSVSQTGLISSIKQGSAQIQALVNGVVVATLDIIVQGHVVAIGIPNNSNMIIGSSFNLSYTLNEMELGDNPTVSYVIVSGADCITIDAQGLVTAVKAGAVQVKVVVNGVESQILSFTVVNTYSETLPQDDLPTTEEPKDNSLLIVLCSVGGATVVGGGGTAGYFIIKKRKLKIKK